MSPTQTSDSHQQTDTTSSSTEDAAGASRAFPKPVEVALRTAMVAYSAYFVLAAATTPLPGLQHRALHLAGGLTLVFILFAPNRHLRRSRLVLGIDLLIAAGVIGSNIYVYKAFETFADRVGLPATTPDVIFGVALLIAMFEAARRMTGWAFPIVTLAFVCYAFQGQYLPAPFTHAGFDLPHFIATFFLTLNGPYGEITQISATYIVVFVIFAAFMAESGTGELIRRLASALVGTVRGGPAKVAVVASSGMGMLTGSSLANVASVGSVTIPMMKRNGYRAEFAGGVEATSGMGAQIMPPIMGGTVFVMIEVLGVPYWDVASSALLLGVLFYLSIFLMVDFQAVRNDLRGEPRSSLPRALPELKRGWYHLLPIAAVIYGLAIANSSPARSAFYGIATSVIIIAVTNKPSEALKAILRAMVAGTRNSLVIVSIVGMASLIAGIVTVTGLGVNLSTILINFAGGNLFILLLITAATSIILGMGVPVLVAYVMLSVLVAPALVDAGVPELAAHMFIFYFGVLSAITPPVAPDAFVAAGIARSNPFRTALEAMRIAGPIYVLPFMFVYDDVLLMQGSIWDIALAGATAALGIYAIAAAWQRVLLPGIGIPTALSPVLGAGGLMLLVPSTVWSTVGLIVLIVVQLWGLLRRNRSTPQPGQEPTTMEAP